MKLVLMGPPASGKGTVGALLSETLQLPIFSVGQLLRDIPESSAFYKPLHGQMDKGELAPDGLTAGVIREELQKDIYSDGYILDGWMRNIVQKDFFDPEPDLVIYINIPEETSIKRISGRRFCPNDDFSCNIYTLPPKNPGNCDLCGGTLVQREDDAENVVQLRLTLFKNETIAVIEYYRALGNLIEVDGGGTPEEVLNLILEQINERNTN